MVSAAAAAAPGGRGCPCARPHRAGPNRTSRPASSPSPHPLGVRGDGGAVLSHGGPARPWRAPSWARGAGRRERRGAAVVKVLPWQRGGTGSPGGPQPPAAQLPGRGSRLGPPWWALPQTGRAPMGLESVAFGECFVVFSLSLTLVSLVTTPRYRMSLMLSFTAVSQRSGQC